MDIEIINLLNVSLKNYMRNRVFMLFYKLGNCRSERNYKILESMKDKDIDNFE